MSAAAASAERITWAYTRRVTAGSAWPERAASQSAATADGGTWPRRGSIHSARPWGGRPSHAGPDPHRPTDQGGPHDTQTGGSVAVFLGDSVPRPAVAVTDFAAAATWRAVRDTDLYMSGTVDSEPVARDEAIAALWRQQRSQLVRLAVGLTGDRDAAEEIVQEAFAALLGRWRFLREVSAAPAYLQRVVVNQARARWRARRRTQVVAAVLPGRREQTAGPDLDAQLDMVAALGRLSWSKRACVLLRYYADLSEAQTAAALGVSVGTVKSQTAKGLQQLAAVIDERGEMR